LPGKPLPFFKNNTSPAAADSIRGYTSFSVGPRDEPATSSAQPQGRRTPVPVPDARRTKEQALRLAWFLDGGPGLRAWARRST